MRQRGNHRSNNRSDRIERALELLFARVDLLERELAEIKTVLRQPRRSRRGCLPTASQDPSDPACAATRLTNDAG